MDADYYYYLIQQPVVDHYGDGADCKSVVNMTNQVRFLTAGW